jgi:hypothetical protein
LHLLIEFCLRFALALAMDARAARGRLDRQDLDNTTLSAPQSLSSTPSISAVS